MFDAQAAAKPRAAAKAAWRNWQTERAQTGLSADIKVGIASSFTDDGLIQFVGAHLLQEGFKPHIATAPYNQLFQVCLDPHTHFGDNCNAVVLLWRLEDLMAAEITAFLAGDSSALASAKNKSSDLVAGIAKLRATFDGMIVVAVPPYPTGLSASTLALDNATGLGAFHRLITGDFVDVVSSMAGIRLFDLDAVQRTVGLWAAFEPSLWYLYRQPFADSFLHEAGTLLGRIIVASRRSPKKCVVVDCDNTLWGGIIGEEGLDGIHLGEDFPGSAYRDFQNLLLHWRQQGVLLAIASKNNEADVWEVFDQHKGMVLQRSHISAFQINWNPKAHNIPLIANTLNIGIDSLVFIDDNLMEINYMRQAQPDVCSVLLPEEPAEIVSTLERLTFFDRLEVSREDRNRADMMRAELDREALSVKMSKEDFLKALELRIELFRAAPEDLGRVAQLINKTNQFNLSTIRRTLEEVRVLAASSDYRLYTLRVADKFGDYGLTGVVIIHINPTELIWHFDTLLLSCRVLGRGVETALLAALAADARDQGIRELTASFVPTRKNALCSSYLPDHGFTFENEGCWRLWVADVPAVPDFVGLVRTGAEVVRAA